MRKNKDIIICPKCGAEYLAGELFIPKYFLGQPYVVERDENHKVINSCGIPMTLEEKYICDFCDTPFKIYADIAFTTKNILNDNVYISDLNKYITKEMYDDSIINKEK